MHLKLLLLLLPLALFAQESREQEIANLPISSYPTNKAWERLGVRDHRGIDCPLLSLHSKHSSGNGEFLDLLPMVDWLAQNGLDILQLLPLNDTTGVVSPYSPITFHALNPIYLSLSALPFMEEASSSLKRALKTLRSFNTTQRVAYESLYTKKKEWLEDYVKEFSKKLQKRPEFQEFLQWSTYWISDYTLFKALRKKYGYNLKKWPEKVRNPSDIKTLKKEYKDDMLYFAIIQSLCFEQMEKVKQHANQKGVFILGDLPFLVTIDSVEVWLNSHLFKKGQGVFQLDYQEGTPTEYVVSKGEDWGLPPYNWDVIAKEDYAIFKNRLKTCSRIYDIFRIDHASGYFTQFEIPVGKSPSEGKWVPTDRKEILANGRKNLSALAESTIMLPTAEDLLFSQSMKDEIINMGIPGIRMFVFENTKNPPYNLVLTGNDYPLISISALSDHDVAPIRLWWEEHPERSLQISMLKGWVYHKDLIIKHQQELLWTDYHSNSLLHIEMLQDILPPSATWPAAKKERINTPGTVSNKNWTYRYKLSVEQLTTDPAVLKTLKTILSPQYQ